MRLAVRIAHVVAAGLRVLLLAVLSLPIARLAVSSVLPLLLVGRLLVARATVIVVVLLYCSELVSKRAGRRIRRLQRFKSSHADQVRVK